MCKCVSNLACPLLCSLSYGVTTQRMQVGSSDWRVSRQTMQTGLEQAKVILTGQQMQKFIQKMHSDPKFSKRCKELLRTGNNKRLAKFLINNGFKLGWSISLEGRSSMWGTVCQLISVCQVLSDRRFPAYRMLVGCRMPSNYQVIKFFRATVIRRILTVPRAVITNFHYVLWKEVKRYVYWVYWVYWVFYLQPLSGTERT